MQRLRFNVSYMAVATVSVISLALATVPASSAGAEEPALTQEEVAPVEELVPVPFDSDAKKKVALAAAEILGRSPMAGDRVELPSDNMRIVVAFEEADGSAVNPSAKSDDDVYYPQWRVTLGTAIYVYATGQNLLDIAGLTYTAASAVVCAPAAAGGAAGILGCAVVAGAIWVWAVNNTWINPTSCYEFRFSVTLGNDSIKEVPFSLC